MWLTVGKRKLVTEVLGIFVSVSSPGGHHFGRDLAPPNSLQALVLGRLRPNNQQNRNTAPPISR